MNNDILNLQFTTIQEPVPDFVYDELKEFVADSNTYRPQPLFLRQQLAAECGVTPDWIYLTNGVDEAIHAVIAARGSNSHLFTPTEYSTFAQFCPGLITHYSLSEAKYTLSTNALADATLIWLANPNNPVGYTEPEQIVTLAKNNTQALVVVDEIYGEYAPQLTVLPYIKQLPNLAVCKGFSKSYGMAGIRLGYVVARPELIAEIKTYATWANVAYPSCGMAAIALKHKEYYESLRATIIKRKESLVAWLSERSCKVIPSFINTIVIEMNSAEEAARTVSDLKAQGVLINFGGNPDDLTGLPNNYISFVVGTDEQIAQLQKALTTVLAIA